MPKVTLKDVAVRAGVSYQTVSKVLNKSAQVSPETAARIWRAVDELHYRPNVSARNLRIQTSNLIGYAWHYTASHVHPILDAFIHSVTNAAELHGYNLLTFVVRDGTAAYRTLYARNQVSGFVLADTVQNDSRVAQLIEHNIPFTAFGRANDDWDFCWVDVDGYAGIQATVEHLLERGHRRIAFITWPEGSQSGWYREQGYLETLQAAGIALDPAWIVRGEHSGQTGMLGLRRLLDLPPKRRPTAVVCVSDQIAIGAMNAGAAAGLVVGKDMASTGFDDMPLVEYIYPPLTSVRQPMVEAGQLAVELLLKQINGQPIEQKGILLKPELIVRESS
ncbi:MAG: LacI family DNA-binding transcriptional regulator [Chloroflexi bacterium]|nr:LacI family DNA-binding transcriptional regulator [Chloroflexota bacterium]